jgi:hypothetical protein
LDAVKDDWVFLTYVIRLVLYYYDFSRSYTFKLQWDKNMLL